MTAVSAANAGRPRARLGTDARVLAFALGALLCCGCGPAAPTDPLGGHPALITRFGVVLPGRPIAHVTVEGAGAPAPIESLGPDLGLVRLEGVLGRPVRIRVDDEDGVRELDLGTPRVVSPVPVAVLDLEALLPLQPGPDPEAHVSLCRLAPDGRSVLLGTPSGYLALAGLPDGTPRFGRRVADGMIKAAVFSPDGTTIYVGEQTRAGTLRALDAATGAERWQFPLSRDLGAGPAPDPTNSYLWVNHPGPYRMMVLPDGDLLVAGQRSGTFDGATPSAARVVRFAPDGSVRWAWPSDAEGRTLALNLPWFDTDADGRLLTFVVAAPLGAGARADRGGLIPPGSVGQLDLTNGRLLRSWSVPAAPAPLADVHFWRSVAVAPNGRNLAISTQDGRQFLFAAAPDDAPWTPKAALALAAPIELSGMPLLATAGTLAATDEEALFVIGDTYVPYAARGGDERPKSPHPAANAVVAVDWQGRFRWRKPMDNFPNGLLLDGSRRWAAVTFSPGASGLGGDRNGVAMFDLAATAGDRFAWEYRVAGAVPYDQFDVSADGRWLVLVEVPYRRAGEAFARGRFRLHLVH